MSRVLLATDSEILRPRLQRAIGEIPRAEIVCDVQDENQIVEMVRLTDPAIVIMFFPKLGQSATQLVPVIRAVNPATTIIVLTTAFSQVGEQAWRNAGSTYVFNLSLQLKEFIDCLTAIAHDEAVRDLGQSSDEVPSNGSI